jgi:hypothetical protein
MLDGLRSMARRVISIAYDKAQRRRACYGQEFTDPVRGAMKRVLGFLAEPAPTPEAAEDGDADIGAMHTGFEILGAGVQALQRVADRVRAAANSALRAPRNGKPGRENRGTDC